MQRAGLNLSPGRDDASTPLKRKLTALYDNQSANGGDPTLSARGGSSKRSEKKSIVDLQLKVLQM